MKYRTEENTKSSTLIEMGHFRAVSSFIRVQDARAHCIFSVSMSYLLHKEVGHIQLERLQG